MECHSHRWRSSRSRSDDGVVTVVTDASGIDGVGDYAFVAGRAEEVWLASEMWPADVQEALTRAAAPQRGPTKGGGRACPCRRRS
eukprot:6033252-Pleurochrysis_carterae.AAC.1